MCVERATEVFSRLLAITTEPPIHEDASCIVARSQEILGLREVELAILRVLLRENPELLRDNQECLRMRDELNVRDKRWADALSWANGELAKRRFAAQRARQAQRAFGNK